MTESKRFFKSGIMLTLVGLAMRTVAMFFGAFISRTVGAEGTGLYTLVMTVYSFALTFATSGISLTVTRLVASAIGERRDGEVNRVLKGAFIFSLLFGSLATLGLFFGADLIGGVVLSDERTITSLKILSFSLIPASLCAALSGYFVGVKRVGFNAAVSVFCQFAKILITVNLVVRLAPYGIVSSVIGLCIGITLTEILGFLLIFFEFLYDRRKNGVKSNNKSASMLPVLNTALPLAFSAYIRSLLLNIEHILIPKKLRQRGENSSEAYSQYGILHGMALPLAIYPMAPLSSFASLLVPEFAEDMAAGRNERMNRVASRAINITLSYSALAAVFLYVFSEELGYVIYNSYDAGYYISFLCIVVPIMYLDHVTDSMLKGIGEQVFSMWVNITDSLLSVLFVCIFIPRMGIIGYALVIVIMEGYNFLLSFIRLKKKIHFSLTPIKSGLVPLVIALVSARISKIIFNFSGSTSPTFWLVMKMLFALSISLFLLALVDIKAQISDKKIKLRVK